jgi:AcrR family transcriptional regulator
MSSTPASQGSPTEHVRVPPSAAERRRATNPQFAARRDEIVDLAANLFATKGYTATGIRDIGDAAQLARGALYYYIDSKESLLGDIHDRIMVPLLEQAHSIAGLRISAAARLRLISEVVLREIIEHNDHIWVVLHENRALTGERRADYEKKHAEFQNVLVGLLSAGVDSGEFVIDDPRVTMLAFMGMHNYTCQWAHSAGPLDLASLSQQYCDLFFRGIERGVRADA